MLQHLGGGTRIPDGLEVQGGRVFSTITALQNQSAPDSGPGEGKASGGLGGHWKQGRPVLQPCSPGPQVLVSSTPYPTSASGPSAPKAPHLPTPVPPPVSFSKLTELFAASGTLRPHWIPVPLGASSTFLPATPFPRPNTHQRMLCLSSSSSGCSVVCSFVFPLSVFV